MSNVSAFAMSHEARITKREHVPFRDVFRGPIDPPNSVRTFGHGASDIACQHVRERRLTIAFGRSIIVTRRRLRMTAGRSKRERDMGSGGGLDPEGGGVAIPNQTQMPSHERDERMREQSRRPLRSLTERERRRAAFL